MCKSYLENKLFKRSHRFSLGKKVQVKRKSLSLKGSVCIYVSAYLYVSVFLWVRISEHTGFCWHPGKGFLHEVRLGTRQIVESLKRRCFKTSRSKRKKRKLLFSRSGKKKGESIILISIRTTTARSGRQTATKWKPSQSTTLTPQRMMS